MIRILHLADVHLDASLSAFGDLCSERREAVLDAFHTLPHLAAQHDVHAVLIAGDLFDSPQPRTSTLARARETIRQTVDSGRPVFVVPGNHDSPTAHPHPYRDDLGGSRVFKEPRFRDPASITTPAGQLHVYGFAYDAAQERDPLSTFRRSDDSGLHIALFHGGFRASPQWKASPNSLSVEPAQLQELDADYIALGDYHRFRPPEGFADDGSIPACYPGSFAAVDLTEEGARGYAVVEFAEGDNPRVTHHESGLTGVVSLRDIDVANFESDAQVADAIADQVEMDAIPVVRLIGSPRFALDGAAVCEFLCARFGHAKVVDKSLHYSSGRLDAIAEKDTIAGHVVRLGRGRIAAAKDDEAIHRADRALRIALQAIEVE